MKITVKFICESVLNYTLHTDKAVQLGGLKAEHLHTQLYTAPTPCTLHWRRPTNLYYPLSQPTNSIDYTASRPDA